ncbi:hypothetical protein [Paraburkholderia sp. BL9I2N2]|nr:hypothetical protein [Paraburkholderia sp. BL9I2N2]
MTGMFMFGSAFGTILMGWLMDRMNIHVVLGDRKGPAGFGG